MFRIGFSFSVCATKLRQRRRDETALAAHSASGPFVKNISIINDCGEMKIEKFKMKFFSDT